MAAASLFIAGGAIGDGVARGRLFAVAGERVAARLRRETFDSLLTQHRLAFFDRGARRNQPAASDCSSLQKLIVQDALGVVRAGLLVGGSCGMMLTLSPQLCAISVCSFPVAAGLSRWMGDKLRERQKGVQDALADAAAEAERAINGMRTVKLFAAEAEVCASYGGRVEAARAQAEDVGLLAAFNEGGVILALNSSMLAVLAVGGQLLVDGVLSYGDLSAFLLYSMTTGMSASSVAGAYAELRRASGASERILQLLAPTAATSSATARARSQGAMARSSSKACSSPTRRRRRRRRRAPCWRASTLRWRRASASQSSAARAAASRRSRRCSPGSTVPTEGGCSSAASTSLSSSRRTCAPSCYPSCLRSPHCSPARSTTTSRSAARRERRRGARGGGRRRLRLCRRRLGPRGR